MAFVELEKWAVENDIPVEVVMGEKWRRRHYFPSFKIGKSVYVFEDKVRAWLRLQTEDSCPWMKED